MFIKKVCQALEKEKVPYAVVGGYAVTLHGAVRGTIDIDLIIKWNLKNLISVKRAMKSLNLEPQLPITAENLFNFRKEYIENKNLIAWSFTNPHNPSEQVDIIITFDLGNRKTKTIRTSGGNIKILNKKDLIIMKKLSGRPQDLEDIKALKELQ
ncbi:MAG: hypothetical protein D6797_08770 [Bdellovibrio sp.]|nr:MAG: hypothetical protein D6797_08770 [Bdellovibrio sp.]